MLRLTYKIPGLINIGPIRSYVEYVGQSDFKIDPLLWIIMCVVVSLVVGLLAFLLLPIYWQVSLLLFLFVLDISLSYPYLKGVQRVDEIEENLPDALRQMSDTLKAGGTYEYALREVANSEYGPLKKEMNNVLRKLEEGENFENALKTLSKNVKSRLIQRTVTIIVDSVAAGAGLADILEQIAEDVRATHRINRERKATTLMQVIFLVAAGSFAAPMIFGFVTTIINFLLEQSAVIATAEQAAAAQGASDIILFSVQAYMFIEVLAVAAMIALMREGKISKTLLYFPILLFLAYVVYFAAQIISAILVGGI